jgi:hypothetical protein
MTTPTRAVNLVAASTDIADVMAAIWADIPNGSWTQVTQTQTSNPGDKSFAIRSPGGAMEINFSNANLGAPLATDIRVGINPDGAGADEITDSEDPAASSSNYSGSADRGKPLSLAPGHTQFIWMEWPDAIMALFKDATRTYTPYGIHAGKVFVQPLATLANPGGGSQVRMDGHAILGDLVGTGSNNPRQWFLDASFYISPRRRLALGQSVTPAGLGDWSNAWTESGGATRIPDSLAEYQIGPDDEIVPAPLMFGPYIGSYQTEYCFYKYLRTTPPICPRFGIWTVAANARYMSIGGNTDIGATSNKSVLSVPVPVGFVPNP